MKFEDFPIIVVDGVAYAHVMPVPGKRSCAHCFRSENGKPPTANCTWFVSRHSTSCNSSQGYGGFVPHERFEAWLVDYVTERITR